MSIANIHGLPVELKCEIFSYLTKKNDLLGLKRVDKTFKNDIEIEYPKYKAKLDAARRIELGWMKFKDRPLWQQVGLVSLCIIFSPVILTYYSPDIIRWASRRFTPRLKAMAQAVAKAALNVLKRVGKKLDIMARWSYQHVLTPAGHAIQWIARKSFETLSWVYRHVLTPLGKGINRVAHLCYDWVLTPLGRALEFFFERIFVPVCRFTCTHIAAPLARLTWRAVKATFRGLQKVLTPVAKGLFRTIRWTYQNIGIPAVRIVRAIAKGLLITLPKKVYQYVLTPIGHALHRISRFVYNYVLTPLGKVLEFLYRQALVPIGHCLQLAGRVLYHHVLTPFSMVP